MKERRKKQEQLTTLQAILKQRKKKIFFSKKNSWGQKEGFFSSGCILWGRLLNLMPLSLRFYEFLFYCFWKKYRSDGLCQTNCLHGTISSLLFFENLGWVATSCLWMRFFALRCIYKELVLVWSQIVQPTSALKAHCR